MNKQQLFIDDAFQTKIMKNDKKRCMCVRCECNGAIIPIYAISKTHLLICSMRFRFPSDVNFSHKARGQFFESLEAFFVKQLLERR